MDCNSISLEFILIHNTILVIAGFVVGILFDPWRK